MSYVPNNFSEAHGIADLSAFAHFRRYCSRYVVLLGALVMIASACASASTSDNPVATANSTARALPAATSSPTTQPRATAVAPAPTSAPLVPAASTPTSEQLPQVVRTGAGVLLDQDLAPLHGQRVGLIAHRASVIDSQPLAAWIDEHPLVELTALFAPEHGLYGEADAGALVGDIVDPTTGVPVYSLYGIERAPSTTSLADVDVLVYDLQDVGVRFYTYTSTLGLAMQSAAAAGVEFIVLDRPNPIGGDRLQGPTLTAGLESFIGMYNVPSAYGLTAGELATLIANQGLLPGLDDLRLTVVPMQNWSRTMHWHDTGLTWIPPSPNLPTPDSALVYPGTVLFEATSISEGRGTDEPFTLIGSPWLDGQALANELNNQALGGVTFEATSFVPRSIPGAAVAPRFEDQELSGVRIQIVDHTMVNGLEVGLSVLDAALRQGEQNGLDPASIIDRPDVFDRLAGGASVRANLLAGISVDEIVASFEGDHAAFAALANSVHLYS